MWSMQSKSLSLSLLQKNSWLDSYLLFGIELLELQWGMETLMSSPHQFASPNVIDYRDFRGLVLNGKAAWPWPTPTHFASPLRSPNSSDNEVIDWRKEENYAAFLPSSRCGSTAENYVHSRGTSSHKWWDRARWSSLSFQFVSFLVWHNFFRLMLERTCFSVPFYLLIDGSSFVLFSFYSCSVESLNNGSML